MKKERIKIGDYFRLSVALYIKNQKRGIQKKIAEILNTDKNYISVFLSGKKIISEDLRATLAEYIGFNYEELISLGRKIAAKSVSSERKKSSGSIYSENFPKNIREKLKIEPKVLAKTLDISETEYIFKENNWLVFTNDELRKLANMIGSLELKEKEYSNYADTMQNNSLMRALPSRADIFERQSEKDMLNQILKNQRNIIDVFLNAFDVMQKEKNNIKS